MYADRRLFDNNTEVGRYFGKLLDIQIILYRLAAVALVVCGFIFKNYYALVAGFLLGIILLYGYLAVEKAKKERALEKQREEEEHWADIMNQVDSQQQREVVKDESEWWDEVYKNLDYDRI